MVFVSPIFWLRSCETLVQVHSAAKGQAGNRALLSPPRRGRPCLPEGLGCGRTWILEANRVSVNALKLQCLQKGPHRELISEPLLSLPGPAFCSRVGTLHHEVARVPSLPHGSSCSASGSETPSPPHAHAGHSFVFTAAVRIFHCVNTPLSVCSPVDGHY